MTKKKLRATKTRRRLEKVARFVGWAWETPPVDLGVRFTGLCATPAGITLYVSDSMTRAASNGAAAVQERPCRHCGRPYHAIRFDPRDSVRG